MRKIIIIKIGSGILMTRHRKLDENRIAHIADQVASLKEEGFGVILVVSGAVACGYNYIKFTGKDQKLKQAVAGIGQSILTTTFNSIFSQKKMQIAQILLSKENLYSITQREKIKDLLEVYIKSDFVAFINENDVLSLNSFGGNDHLAGEITILLNADRLLILSSQKGSSFGVGGGETKQEVINLMKTKSIKVDILNGRAPDIILNTIL